MFGGKVGSNMIKTALGAQRYNNKMNKIFEQAKISKKVVLYDELVEILKESQDYIFGLPGYMHKKTMQVLTNKIEQALTRAKGI